MLKAVILIGESQKGLTPFRALAPTPKSLFPIAGLPLIQHHIAACAKLKECKEILIIGFYPTTHIDQFVADMQKEYHVTIRYLQEFTPLGTGGGLYHFKDQLSAGNPSAFFLLNGDVCADFPLRELWTFHKERSTALVTIMGTEVTRQQSVNYGCMVCEASTNAVTHYVEKPHFYLSTLINCGVYVCSLQVLHMITKAFKGYKNRFHSFNAHFGACFGYISWEQDVLSLLAGTNKLYAMQVFNWWSQVKTVDSAIHANRHYLEQHKIKLEPPCHVYPNVYLHPSAVVDSTAVIGPNVSVSAWVRIKAGVRIKESIILQNATIDEHALVMYSVVGQEASVGAWARVEGTPADPDPNKPFAKMDNQPLSYIGGRLSPSITVLGEGVVVPAEIMVLNCIVFPHTHISRSLEHEIIL